MKKLFTKLLNTALVAGLLITAANVQAQTTLASTETMNKKDAAATEIAPVTAVKTEVKKQADPVDTSWHPQRRIWGYTFGDFYYDAHSPLVTSSYGKENNYNGVPTYRNAFQFRRLYLGYDYEINKKFKVEVLLASEPNANTGVNGTTSIQNGDNLVDNKMSFWIKNFNLRIREIWTGTDLVFGELSTPGFALNEPGTNGPTSLSESTWGYRSIEKTITDFHKNNSYDVGAALQGTFDVTTKNYGYVLMVGNNSTSSLLSAANANTGFYKIFYGDLWGKFLNKKLYVDFYADYAKTQGNTPVATTVVSNGVLGTQEHNMFKVFVSYNTSPLSVGVEAYTQKFAYGVTNKTTLTAQDATAQGISAWAKGSISKDKWGWFARYDAYNPDTKITGADAYAVNTNYGSFDPTVKETFVTGGFDYTPAKNIHLMPNVWFVQYKNNLDAATAGYQPDNHSLVYRMTFFYTFGK